MALFQYQQELGVEVLRWVHLGRVGVQGLVGQYQVF